MKVISVHAISLDGAIASDAVESDDQRMNYGLTSTEDQIRVEQLMKQSDAVITGSNSLVSEGVAREVKNTRGKNVSWYIYTNKGLPSNLDFWSQKNIERYLISESDLKDKYEKGLFESSGVNNLIYEKSHPAEFLIRHLQEKNTQQVLLFGGGTINKIFFEKNLVSHLEYTICPTILGGFKRVNLIQAGLTHPNTAKLMHTEAVSNHVFLTYELNNTSSLLK